MTNEEANRLRDLIKGHKFIWEVTGENNGQPQWETKFMLLGKVNFGYDNVWSSLVNYTGALHNTAEEAKTHTEEVIREKLFQLIKQARVIQEFFDAQI